MFHLTTIFVLIVLTSVVGAQQISANAYGDDGREELGDVWNSATTYGEKLGLGVDVTNQILVEQILEPASEYRYAAFGKPDPFIAPFELLAGLARTKSTTDNKEIPLLPSGEEIAIISPLQTDINNLRVIGLWQLADGARKALISNGASQAVVAEVGDAIGYTGRITDIQPEGVISRQYNLREDGSREYEDVLLVFGDQEASLQQQMGQRIILSPDGSTKVESTNQTPPEKSDNKSIDSKAISEAVADELKKMQSNGQINVPNQQSTVAAQNPAQPVGDSPFDSVPGLPGQVPSQPTIEKVSPPAVTGPATVTTP